jgi:predicted ATPase with chaperone activity
MRDLTIGQAHLRRAIEIALVGGHTLWLIDSTNADGHTGYYPGEVEASIRERFGEIFAPSMEMADMAVAKSTPTPDMILARVMDKDATLAIRSRVSELVKTRDRHGLYANHLTNGAREMLRTAFNRLHLKASDTMRILEVAATIQFLDTYPLTETTIDAQHIAEAINYITAKYENV